MGDIHYQKDKEIQELMEENDELSVMISEQRKELENHTKIRKELMRHKLELELKVKVLSDKLLDIRHIVNGEILK